MGVAKHGRVSNIEEQVLLGRFIRKSKCEESFKQ